MGTKKAAKRTTAHKKKAPKVTNEMIDQRDQMRRDHDASKASRTPAAADDRLPDNTPVWLRIAQSVPRRALLTRYEHGAAMCRIGFVDEQGAYTGRLGNEERVDVKEVLGPIWLIADPTTKWWPNATTPEKVLADIVEATKAESPQHEQNDIAPPTDAELLNRMGAPGTVTAHNPVVDGAQRAEAAKPATMRKPRMSKPKFGVGHCPRHNVELAATTAGMRECIVAGCRAYERLNADGTWSPGIMPDLAQQTSNVARCPVHGFELHLMRDERYRTCPQRGCAYTERKVNDEWSKVPAEEGKVIPWTPKPLEPAPDAKPTTPFQNTVATAARPVPEVDPKCPAHGRFLIQTRTGDQKLCPVDSCDYFIAKQGDTWRVMHEVAPSSSPATREHATGRSPNAAPSSEFLPPLEDNFDTTPPWET